MVHLYIGRQTIARNANSCLMLICLYKSFISQYCYGSLSFLFQTCMVSESMSYSHSPSRFGTRHFSISLRHVTMIF